MPAGQERPPWGSPQGEAFALTNSSINPNLSYHHTLPSGTQWCNDTKPAPARNCPRAQPADRKKAPMRSARELILSLPGGLAAGAGAGPGATHGGAVGSLFGLSALSLRLAVFTGRLCGPGIRSSTLGCGLLTPVIGFAFGSRLGLSGVAYVAPCLGGLCEPSGKAQACS